MGTRLKVFLVDDEEHIRNLVKKHIQWTELDLEVIGEASSGREALDMMEREIPDIVITDIRMPYMDGLEFAGILRETYPFVKVIILTASEEFEMAKKSIKLGVSDYLTKPINRPEFKTCLTSIVNKIMDENMNTSKYTELKARLAINFEQMKERFFLELLNKPVIKEEILERVKYYSVESILNFVQISIIAPTLEASTSTEDNALMNFACIDIIKEYLVDYSEINVFNDMNNNIVLMCSEPNINIEKVCEHLMLQIVHRLKCDVAVGLSQSYRDCKYIKQAYLEAEEALKYSEILGVNQVICYRDVCIKNCTDIISQDFIDELLFYMKAGIEDKAAQSIAFIADNYIKEAGIEQTRIYTSNLAVTVLNSVADLGEDFLNVCDKRDNYICHIQKIDNYKQAKDFLENLVMNITAEISNIRKRKSNKLLNEILSFINDNIDDPGLTLSSIASRFYINSSYLSRIYKQEMGQSFVEHLTKMRIDKAINLMNETELKVYQIGEKVGIPDPNYFGKCFKKFTGLCFNDYKRQYGIQ